MFYIYQKNGYNIEAMSQRFIKQLIYGSGCLVVFSVLLVIGYWLFVKPAPTCTDNIKNQREEEIDCGGPRCVPCAMKNLQQLHVLPMQLFDTGDNRTTVFVQIQNSNSDYGGSIVPYILNLYDQSGAVLFKSMDKTFVYANTIKSLVIPVLDVPFQKISRSDFFIGNITWSASAVFIQPKFELREIATVVQDDLVMVSGIVQNTNAFTVREVLVSAVAVDQKGLFVNASKTIIKKIAPFSEAPFKIFMPVSTQEKILLDTKRTKMFVDGIR